MIRDWRIINEAVTLIHPSGADPCPLLSQLSGDTGWYTVLDLKDTFFFLPLHLESQFLFAFEWKDTNTREKQQFTWTVLPPKVQRQPSFFH